MTIVSEALLAIGIIMVSMAFVLVGGNIISFQTEGLFQSTQNRIPAQISKLVREMPSASGTYSTTFQPSIESYTLQIQSNRTITAEVPDAGRSSTTFLDYRMENTVIRNAEEICITKKSDNVSITSGSCQTDNLNNFCANGRCINGICQVNRGETCANSGGDCTCNTQCQPDYEANSHMNPITGAGDNTDDTNQKECVLPRFVGSQDNSGDKCEYDFECGTDSGQDLQCNSATGSSGLSNSYCCPQGKNWNGSQCEDVDKLKLVFVPLNTKNGDYNYGNGVSTQSSFFEQVYPVSSQDVKFEKLTQTCNVPVDQNSCSNDDRRNTLQKVQDCAINQGHGNADHYVGMFQNNICQNIGPSNKDVAGWSVPTTPSVVSEAGFKEVTAHEIGHNYGLNDEYIDACRYTSIGNRQVAVSPEQSNCLKTSLNGDKGYPSEAAQDDPSIGMADNSPFCAGGTQEPDDYSVYCAGNLNSQGGRSIMSYAGAPTPRRFSTPSLNYLNTLGDFS